MSEITKEMYELAIAQRDAHRYDLADARRELGEVETRLEIESGLLHDLESEIGDLKHELRDAEEESKDAEKLLTEAREILDDNDDYEWIVDQLRRLLL